MSKGPEDVHIDDGEDGGNGDDNSALCEGIDENACLFQSVAKLGLLQTHINFPRFLPIFPDFLEATFAFSPYLLAPITRDHQMLKSPHSLDPLASCPPHVGLTDHTWRAAFHMFASCPTHVRSLASPFPHGRLPCHTMTVLIHQSSSCTTHGRVM
jgi:hypothetical protein